MIQELPHPIESSLQTENPAESTPSHTVNNPLLSATKSRPKKQRRKSNVIGNTAEKGGNEIKNEGTTTENNENTIPLHPDIVSFKNNVKNYIQELKNLLIDGLEQYKIEVSPDFLEKIKQEFQETSEEEKLKSLLERLLAPFFDSKFFNYFFNERNKINLIHNSRSFHKLSELILSSRDHVNTLTDKFQCWDQEKYKDFIMNVFERKNYLDRMKLPFLTDEINTNQFYIFEIKNVDNLAFFSDMTEVNNTRRKRVHKMKIVEALYRLIQSIEKAKTVEDLDKINKLLDVYYKKKQEKLRLIEPKKSNSDKKRKLVSSKDSTEKDNASTPNQTVSKSLKKLKIDSDKESFITGKDQDQASDSEIPMEKPIIEEPAKDAETEKSKKKQNNQKTILSFFTKKSPKKSDVKALNQKEKEEKKSIFRCVGFSNPNTYQPQIKESEEKKDPSEILADLKMETLKIKKLQKRPNLSKKFRRVYFFLWDSLKKYNGVGCELVASRVQGRRPFQKEDFINYEVDSDEEIEEQNATDISSDEKEIDEEDENESEDEDGKFVVPDGYLSQEEKFDEDGDPEINRPVLNTQQNTSNFQSNKAFLFRFENYQKGKDSNLDEFVENFKVFQIYSDEMPIPVKKHRQNEINAKGEELWNNEEIMRAFVRLVHGSFDSRPAIINEFVTRFQNLSKASIERKIKEISKKEKVDGQTKAIYIVNKEIFEALKLEPESEIILKEKIDLNAKKEMEIKKEQELKKTQTEEKKEELPQREGKIMEEGKIENNPPNSLPPPPERKPRKSTTPKKSQTEKTAAGNTSNSKGQKTLLNFMKSHPKKD